MISLDVPYFQQDTTFTCGPAALQMVMAYHGIRISEAELRKRLKTNEETGTRRARMKEVVTDLGLHCYVNNQAMFDEFTFLLKLGAPIIVRFLEPDEGIDHYGVIVGANDSHVIIHDPWHGPSVTFSKKDFLPRWTCDLIGDCDQWIIAVSKELLPLGRQY